MGLTVAVASPATAWDSEFHNPGRSTHTLILKWAIEELKKTAPEVETYKEALVDGANTELHELKVRKFETELGTKYKVDLEAKRVEHRGTNEGCDKIEGWWKDALAANKAGNKKLAYFYAGVMVHMIEDMGVPAHANKLYHQGTLKDFDNFELMALSNWKPSFDAIDKKDPAHAEPWKYYEFSQKWTAADAPKYKDTSTFSKFWTTASKEEKALLSNRQGRTCHVVKWTLGSITAAFK